MAGGVVGLFALISGTYALAAALGTTRLPRSVLFSLNMPSGVEPAWILALLMGLMLGAALFSLLGIAYLAMIHGPNWEEVSVIVEAFAIPSFLWFLAHRVRLGTWSKPSSY